MRFGLKLLRIHVWSKFVHFKFLSELDFLLSFADLAASSPTPYTRSDITPSVRILGYVRYYIGRSRHPCVEAQDWVNFIPNDCKLVRGKCWFQIITGPNMGGKSTFIRQVEEDRIWRWQDGRVENRMSRSVEEIFNDL
ncbi:putative DNA mismatch repair protein Msh2 [Helianthus annuus]|nr:putative DNA mismatch repair protein Msh2 [Helianthus annuus]